MYDILFSFITSFLLTFLAVPSIITVAQKRKLTDQPNERSSHSVEIPSLGGIAIFAGMIFSLVLWTPFYIFGDLQYILCSCILVFLIGIRDDLLPLSADKKLLGQIFAAGLLVVKSDIKLTSLYGVMGIYDIPDWVAIPLSLFVIIVIINSFNLIDGINGLAGFIGLLISTYFGVWFFLVDSYALAILSFSLAGALIGFLRYNLTPAKIFMGDTGSLLTGLVASILAIKFIEYNKVHELSPFHIRSAPAVAFGVLILPLFDTLRVFMVRILRGRSPFVADRTHLHHYMIEAGFTHMQATSMLLLVNLFCVVSVTTLQDLGPLVLLTGLLITLCLFTLAVVLYKRYRHSQVHHHRAARSEAAIEGR